MGGLTIFLGRPSAIVFILAAVALAFISIRLLKKVPKEMLGEDAEESATGGRL
jgi:hypothetical protein